MVLKNKRQKSEVLTSLFMLGQKKGAEKIISVYWFLILILVAGSIAYMVSAFYGQPYDVREIEANILINNVAECLSDKGNLIELNENLKDDFLNVCYLNFGADSKNGDYYLEVDFLDFKTDKVRDFKISEGNINLKNIAEASPGTNSIFVSSKSFYVLNNDQELIVRITSIIGKEDKNVQ